MQLSLKKGQLITAWEPLWLVGEVPFRDMRASACPIPVASDVFRVCAVPVLATLLGWVIVDMHVASLAPASSSSSGNDTRIPKDTGGVATPVGVAIPTPAHLVIRRSAKVWYAFLALRSSAYSIVQ